MQGVTMVRIGGLEIGIVDLEEIFTVIEQEGIEDEGQLKTVLLQHVKEKNYVPSSKETEYTEGLWKAYRRHLGEKIEEEIEDLKIQILGQGCARCDKLEQDVRALLSEMNLAADVEHVKDPVAISRYGVLGIPALVINGVVKSAGRVPKRDQIVAWIEELQNMKE